MKPLVEFRIFVAVKELKSTEIWERFKQDCLEKDNRLLYPSEALVLASWLEEEKESGKGKTGKAFNIKLIHLIITFHVNINLYRSHVLLYRMIVRRFFLT